MIVLTQSNRLEELADALIDDIGAARAGDPFAAAVVAVPSSPVAAWLQLRMAGRAGIAANLRFPFLDSYLAARARARALRGAPERILERSALEALLCGTLADPAVLAGDEMAPVRDYLAAAGAAGGDLDPPEARDALELRRFQLAREVAGLFFDYALTRPQLAAAWPERALYGGGPFAAAEAWQRRLWLAVLGPDGALARLDGGVRWLLPPAYLEAVPAAELELPDPLHLFGLTSPAPAWYRMLERLGEATELRLYVFNPCREFWEDAAGRGGEADEQPALRLWGRAGREQVRRLGSLAGLVEHGERDRFVDALAGRQPSLLARLQHDVLARRDRAQAAADPRPALERDDSVRLLACPGIRRELEIIGAEIWRLLRDDRTLRFDDIAVLFPRGDAERYQAQVSAVFAELGDLPHHLLDAPLAGPGRVLEAFALLLDLPFGQFTRPELLRLLTHPAVTARFPDLDPSQWVRWAVRLGIVHGADAADHRDTYIEEDVFHWDQGIRRLALGAVMAGADTGVRRPFEVGRQAWLPEEVGQESLPSAGRFALLARSLIADARFVREQRLPLARWATLLDLVATTYLGARTEEDERHLLRCREAIASLRERDLDGRAVGYRTACEMIRAEVAGLRGPRGQPLADGVLVAPLAPGRALPFRVLFVAGMGEGRFPASERDSPLDLRAAAPVPADVGPRERDRWLFLETVLAARDRLYLSWVARDEQTGEELEPSSVVIELERMLAAELAAPARGALRVRHPLRRWDPHYYPELLPAEAGGGNGAPRIEAGPDPVGARQAQALALRRDLERHYRGRGQAPPPPDRLRAAMEAGAWTALAVRLELDPGADRAAAPAAGLRVTLPLAELRRFLECPMQTWAGRVLGLREEDLADPIDDGDEPFEVGPMDSVMLLREVFVDHLLAGDSAAQLRQRHERAARLRLLGGRAPVGPFGRRAVERDRNALAAWRTELERDGALAGPWRLPQFGRAPEHRAVDRLAPPIALAVSAGGVDLAVELYGRTEPVGHRAGLVTLVNRASERHRLRSFIDHLALAAAGEEPAGRALILAADGKHAELRLKPVPPEAARAYLAGLAGELLGDRHAYLLPCEAVLPCLAEPGRSLADQVRRTVASNRSHSSKWGPVDRIETLEPLPDARAREVVERRFGLFRDLVEVVGG